jgi:hypothetical protein
MSAQINTFEDILQINENNDKTQNLGDDAAIVEQNVNGIDLLKERAPVEHGLVESFAQIFPENYRNEMSDYANASTEHEKDVVLNNYDKENHVVHQPMHNDVNDVVVVEEKREPTSPPQVNYELMYKDNVCAFFIGSISIISLYAVFKLIERD